MAIQKITTSSSKASSIEPSLKGSNTTNSSSIKPKDLQNPKSSIGNSLKISINEDISRVELTQNVPYDELLKFLQGKTLGAGIAKNSPESQLLKEFMDCLVENQSKNPNSLNLFSLSASPSGGVNCSLFKVAGGFSYKLERKKQEMLTTISAKKISQQPVANWNLVVDSSSYGYLHVKDESVVDGCRYIYRLTIKNLNNNVSQEFEDSILYKKTSVMEFCANLDVAEKKIVICCDVKNAGSIKITRAEIVEKENKQQEKINVVEIVRADKIEKITFPYEDKNVVTGKVYRYELEVLDALTSVPIKRTSTIDCNDIVPKIINLEYDGISISSRKTNFKWKTSYSVSKMILERRVANEQKWITILSNTYNKNYPESFSVCDNDSMSVQLLPDTSYEYRVTCSNGWGTDSKTVNVETFPAPGKIRLLPPEFSSDEKGITCNFRWIGLENIVRYEISRRNCVRNEVDMTRRLDGDANSLTCSIQNDVLYKYEIKAINSWGTSVRYLDVKRKRKSIVAKNDANRYRYIGQNTNDENLSLNFQGITTDGKWWYLTNGVPSYKVAGVEYKSTSDVYLRKRSVDKSLDKDVSSDYEFPEDSHAGDLDCYGDYLFVAVYKNNKGNYDTDSNNKKHCHGQIWIFNKNTMKRITTEKLLGPDRITHICDIPWCAVNPFDKRLYTSSSYIYDQIISYEINFENIKKIENGEEGLEVFSSPQIVRLHGIDGTNGKPGVDGISFTKESMQGGCFDYYGNLYLTSGYKDPAKLNQGIHVLKLIFDEDTALQNVLSKAVDDEDRVKKYESFISGDCEKSYSFTDAVLVAQSENPYYHQKGLYLAGVWGTVIRKDLNSEFIYQFNVLKEQEPEGIAYCDFRYTPRTPPQSYVNEGSLHASLLINSDPASESMLLKHYEHKYEETEEKNIYYDNENLTINDGKIYDNGILVQKFEIENDNDCKNYVNASKTMLEKFRKIHIIGCLNTSSPDHNYEFRIMTTRAKPYSDYEDEVKKIYKAIEYNPTQFVDPLKGCTCGYSLSQERYDIPLQDKKGNVYHFYAHNESDAISICSILGRYKKLCYIGVGPDKERPDIGRIRSKNNLIWFES